MNAALWLLIGLQLRGWLRFFSRGLLTLRGALLAILGGTFFLLWLVSVVFANHTRAGIQPAFAPSYGPGMLLAYCLLNVLLSPHERGVHFTPSEVNFLFPAPVGRRSLLAYKIVSSLIIGLPSCFVLSAISYGYASSFLNAFVGMLLIVTFMQLFGMALNLIAITVGTRLFSRGRRLLGIGVMLFGVLLLWQTGGTPQGGQLFRKLHEVGQTWEWRAVTLPLTWFFKVFEAQRVWPDLVQYAGLGLLVNVGLLGIVFALDAQFMEAAASAGARDYKRLRRRGIAGGSVTPPRFRFSLPMPPAFGGIGTICWRQLTTTLRMPSRLVIMFILFVAVVGATHTINVPGADGRLLAALSGGMVLVVTVLWSALFPFDFRGDVDHLALLKTLPIAPWRLALGQVLSPVLIITLLQWLILALLYLSGAAHFDRGRGLSLLWQPGMILVLYGLFALPINGLLFALENLLFLLFPTRVLANNPADFQALGRNVLFLMAKIFVLSGVLLVGLMVGVVVGVFFPLLGLMLAWLTLAFFVAPLIPLIGWAFTVFDVGRDTPA